MDVQWMDIVAGIVGGFVGAIFGFWAFVGGLGIELYGAYKGEYDKFSKWGISLTSGGLAGWLHGTARNKGFADFWSAFDYNINLTDRVKALANVSALLTPKTTVQTAIEGSTGGLYTV